MQPATVCYPEHALIHTATLTQNHLLQQPPLYNGQLILPQTGCNGEILIILTLSYVLIFIYLIFLSIFLSNQDPDTNTYWMIYDKTTGKPTPLGVDSYKPPDDSTTIFRLVTGASHEEATTGHEEVTTSPTVQDPSSSPDKLAGVGLVSICLLAVIEALLLL